MKGQTWSIDLAVSITIFVIIISLFFFSFNIFIEDSASQEEISKLREITLESSELLIRSVGLPPDWNSTNVKSVGLASSENIIDSSKIEELLDIEYYNSKGRMGLTNYDYRIRMTHLNDSIIKDSSGLEGLYHFTYDKNLDGKIIDYSSNLYHASCSFCPIHNNDGKFKAGSFYFNGDKFLDVPLPSGTFESTGNFTLSVWVNSEPLDEETTSVMFDVGTDISFYLRGYPSGSILAEIDMGGYYIQTSPDINPDNWYHVAVTYSMNTTEVKMYINGVESGNDFTDQTLLFDYFFIGTTFKGKMDEISIWNRVLNQDEIQNLYTSAVQNPYVKGTNPDVAKNVIKVVRYGIIDSTPARINYILWGS